MILKIDNGSGKVRALDYMLFATAICVWATVVFLMIDGHIFGDSTTGLTAVSFIVSLGCWTNLKRRFRWLV